MQVVETTTTTRRTVWRRRRAPLLLHWLPILGMVVVLLLGLTTTRAAIESDLEERAVAALATVADVDSVSVTFVGRDAVVTGTVDGTATVDAVVASIERLDGVRIIDVSGVAVEDGTTG